MAVGAPADDTFWRWGFRLVSRQQAPSSRLCAVGCVRWAVCSGLCAVSCVRWASTEGCVRLAMCGAEGQGAWVRMTGRAHEPSSSTARERKLSATALVHPEGGGGAGGGEGGEGGGGESETTGDAAGGSCGLGEGGGGWGTEGGD